MYSNQIETLLSSSCQLGLGVALRHHSLSSYRRVEVWIREVD